MPVEISQDDKSGIFHHCQLQGIGKLLYKSLCWWQSVNEDKICDRFGFGLNFQMKEIQVALPEAKSLGFSCLMRR